jgi:DNA ligase-1
MSITSFKSREYLKIPMNYSSLVEVYEALGKTTKRLEKTRILSELFKKTDDLEETVCLLNGRVFPDWDRRELGFSSRLMLKAISMSAGVGAGEVEREWKKRGDLGKVAKELSGSRKQSVLFQRKLTTKAVVENLRKMPGIEGKGAVDRKVKMVVELLNNSKPSEAEYVVKMVLGELRIGVAKGIIRDAIAGAFEVDAGEVERAYNSIGDYGEVAERVKKDGEKGLENVGVMTGKPMKVMLAIKVGDIKEAFEAVGKPAEFEYKLDGFRVIISRDEKGIKLFTRRMEDVTKQFPDVVKAVQDGVKGKEFVIDAEIVGYDRKTGKYVAFQGISQRIKRKYDIEKMAKEFPVEVNVFDVIYHDGRNFVGEGFKERRKILEKIVKVEKKKIVVVWGIVTGDEKEAEKFYKEALEAGHEGVMVKKIDSAYVPGRYVGGWVKLKNVMESLDLVITGAQWGEGKRSGWLSSFILSCRSGKKFLSIGKVGTGIKEKAGEGITFKELTKELKPHITASEGRDVAVKPVIVVEVGYEEIQKSPSYESGYALRFPRVVRVRYDRRAEDCDELARIEGLYRKQRGRE